MKLAFCEVFDDYTSRCRKIPKEEYLSNGKYIVIDQGQNNIAGYTNIDDGLFEDVPAIVFGDHTRIIKYVDEPFFLGADGVKLLKSKIKDANYKYLYYVLRNARIPDTGYNRHFKWLKEINLEYKDEESQKNIVKTLDTVTNIIELYKVELSKLDNLIRARFFELFGDLVEGDKIKENRRKIGDIASVTKLAGFEFTKYIKYKDIGSIGDVIMLRGLNCKRGKLILDDIKWIERETSDLLPRSKLYIGDILITYAGTIGDVALVDEDNKYHLAPNVGKITIIDKLSYDPVFLVHLLMYSNKYIMSFASKVAQASINMQKIRNFEYYFPGFEKQKYFSTFVEQVNKSKVEVQKALDKAQLLFDSLMQKYFG